MTVSVIRTIVGTIATKGAGFVITLLVGVALFRTMGPEGKGEVDGLITWMMLLLLTYPSLEEPQLYLIGRKTAAPSTLLVNAVFAALLFGAAVIGVFELIVARCPEWLEYRETKTDVFRSLDVDRLRLLMLIAPIALLQKTCGGLLQGLRDMRAFNACFLAQNGTLLVLVGIFVLGLGRGVDGAIMAYAGGFSVGGLCALGLALRHPQVRGGPYRPSLGLLGRLVGSGLRIHGGVVAAWVIIESDKLIVLRYGTPSELALYVLAVALTGHLRRLIVQPVKEVLGSRLPDMIGDRKRMIDAIARTTRHVVLLTVVPSAALAALGFPILWVLYGSDALPAYAPLLVLVPGSVLWGAAVMISYWFIGTERFLTLTVIGLGVAATNLALNFAFVPDHGMLAAAASSSICYGIHLTVFVLWIRATEGVSPARFLVPRREDLSVYRDAWQKVRSLLGGSR